MKSVRWKQWLGICLTHHLSKKLKGVPEILSRNNGWGSVLTHHLSTKSKGMPDMLSQTVLHVTQRRYRKNPHQTPIARSVAL
jgi:hypothetical protein